MSLECAGSSSATIYFRAKGAAEYEKYFTESCPVDVEIGVGLTSRWSIQITATNLKSVYYIYPDSGEASIPTLVDRPPIMVEGISVQFGSSPPTYSIAPNAEYGYDVSVSGLDPTNVDSDADGNIIFVPLYGRPYSGTMGNFGGWTDIDFSSKLGSVSVAIARLSGDDRGGKIKITDRLGKIFEKEIAGEIEWYAACDCEEGCLPVYGDEESDEFICICTEEDDEDIEKMKERIKQELLVELPPIIKSQLKAELVPELKTQLPEDETFKGSVIAFVKAALSADDEFKNGIKDAVKAGLIADLEFKAAMSTATKERFVSDQPYQKEWLDIIAAAIKANADGDANGYPIDVGGTEVRVKQEGGIPKSLSFAASASPTTSAIEDTLAAKYGGSWSTSGYTTATGKTTAQITRVS